jgi:hypothetical protein
MEDHDMKKVFELAKYNQLELLQVVMTDTKQEYSCQF